MRIQIDVQGERQLGVALGKIADGVSDLTPYWDDIQSLFYKTAQQIFKSEGASGAGGKWKELSTPYKQIKAKQWGNVPILTASGRLQDSLTSETSDSVVEKQKDSLTLGSSVEYGVYHQYGTSKMPKRAPIELTQEQKYEMLRALTRQLAAEAKKAGFE